MYREKSEKCAPKIPPRFVIGRLTFTAFDHEWSEGLNVAKARVIYSPMNNKTNHEASRMILLAKIRGEFWLVRFLLIIFFDFLLDNNCEHSYKFLLNYISMLPNITP